MTAAFPTLADEVLAALPALMVAHSDGPTARVVAQAIAADEVSVRRAFLQLDKAGRARLIIRRRTYHLVTLDHPALGCRNCHREFVRLKKSKAVCCSRSCAVAWSWMRPDVSERRSAGIKAQKQTPVAKEHHERLNRERWARPGEREKMSEQNRRRWADPATKASLSAAIQAALGSPESREAGSRRRKKMWAEPAYRAKTIEAMRRGHSMPDARKRAPERMKARWQDPVWRKKWLKAVRANAAKATAANRGKKQSAEQVRKRVESTRRTRLQQEASP